MFSHSLDAASAKHNNVSIESAHWVANEDRWNGKKARETRENNTSKRHQKLKRYPNYVACDATLTSHKRETHKAIFFPLCLLLIWMKWEEKICGMPCTANKCQLDRAWCDMTRIVRRFGNEVLESDAFYSLSCFANAPDWWLYTRLIVSKRTLGARFGIIL